MPVAVAIVEDSPDVRIGTSFILRSSKTCTVVGEYEMAEELFDGLDTARPEVVLMDLGLPGMSGIEAIRRLKLERPRVEIVVLSIFEDDDNIFRAICAGASGYLTKPVQPQQLLDAVEFAFGGGTPMSPHIARKVLDQFRRTAPPPRPDYDLTAREFEILELLVNGDDYGEIAGKLFLSIFTVRAHVRNIYDKLHVHTKTQAVAKALKENVLPPR